jgi:hypothetical protein
MPSRFSRWTLLLVLAACNLVFWLGVAAATGLLVSREVDLGVETLIRERQATAAIFWKDAITRVPQQLAPQTSTASVPTSDAVGQAKTVVARTAGEEVTRPADASGAQEPRDPEVRTKHTASPETVMTPYPAVSSPPAAPTPLPTGQVQPTQALSSPATPTAASDEAAAITKPQATPVSAPLLLSDLELGDLAHLNEEMDRSAVGRAVQIRYGETMLNQEIQRLLQTSPDLPYRNVEVDLKRGHVVLSGEVLVLGFDVSTEIVGNVVAEDCLPRLETQSVSIAGVLTPGFVKEQVREMADGALSWYQADYPLCLDQIVLEEERATLYGHRR